MVRVAPEPILKPTAECPVTKTPEDLRRVHVPGMFVEFKLGPLPPPMSVLRDSLIVHAMRDESKTFVDLRYVLENGETPGPCEADAIFRMFEGERAPPRPLSDEEQYELRRKRQVRVVTHCFHVLQRLVVRIERHPPCKAISCISMRSYTMLSFLLFIHII